MCSEHDVGMKVRRTVLGDDYVDQVLRETTGFTRDFQQLLTKYCWGSVWARRGLSWRDRSLINVGMLVALNRPHELRLHVSGAIRNGCSAAEISEVLLQAAVYCGIPAAAAAYAIASQVLADAGLGSDGAGTGDPAPAPGVKTERLDPRKARAFTQREIGHDGDRHHERARGDARPRAVRRKPAVR